LGSSARAVATCGRASIRAALLSVMPVSANSSIPTSDRAALTQCQVWSWRSQKARRLGPAFFPVRACKLDKPRSPIARPAATKSRMRLICNINLFPALWARRVRRVHAWFSLACLAFAHTRD